jgi:hypothetical protein
MATPSWKISGQYYETCSCDYVCPCILGQMIVSPTRGDCIFSMAFRIEHGNYGALPLNDIGFIVLGRTPDAMIKGNWSVGVIIDQQASAEQRDAVTAIVSGAAGGPMSVLSGLVGTFLGVESAPIRFDRRGVKWSVEALPFVDMGAEGAMGVNPELTEPMHLSNCGHPANDRLALCHASKSIVRALGLTWQDLSGRNSGHYAPFAWQVA